MAFEFEDEAEQAVGTAVGFVVREAKHHQQPGSEIQRTWIAQKGTTWEAVHTSPDTPPNLALFNLATEALGG